MSTINEIKDIFLDFSERVAIFAEDYAKISRMTIEVKKCERQIVRISEKLGSSVIKQFREKNLIDDVTDISASSAEILELEEKISTLKDEILKIKSRSR